MPDSTSGCNCCGCPGELIQILPAWEVGVPTCFVRTIKDENTYRFERTTVYPVVGDPEVTDGSETLDSTSSTDVETTDSIPAVGNWTFLDVKRADESVTSPPISDTTDGEGVRTVVEEVFRYSDDIQIIRKLAVEFDISWENRFGVDGVNPPTDLIATKWISTRGHNFTILDFDNQEVSLADPIDYEADLGGWKLDTALPTDHTSFDTLFATLTQNYTTPDDNMGGVANDEEEGIWAIDLSTGGLNTNGTTLTYYFDYSGTNGGVLLDVYDAGDYLSGIRFGWDDSLTFTYLTALNAYSNPQWKDFFTSPSINVFKSEFTIELDQGFEVPIPTLATELSGWSLKVELLDSLDATEFEITLSMTGTSTGLDPPYPAVSYNLIGNSPSFDQLWFDDSLLNAGPGVESSATFQLHLRDGCIQIGRAIAGYQIKTFEETFPTYYDFYPFFTTLSETEYKVRLTWLPTTTAIAFQDFRWYGLNALYDSDKNPLCPGGTCENFEPYAHLQWRIVDFDTGGLTYGPVDRIRHQGCRTTMEVDSELPSSNGWAEIGSTRLQVTYRALEANLYRPIMNGDITQTGTWDEEVYYVIGTPPTGDAFRAQYYCEGSDWLGFNNGYQYFPMTHWVLYDEWLCYEPRPINTEPQGEHVKIWAGSLGAPVRAITGTEYQWSTIYDSNPKLLTQPLDIIVATNMPAYDTGDPLFGKLIIDSVRDGDDLIITVTANLFYLVGSYSVEYPSAGDLVVSNNYSPYWHDGYVRTDYEDELPPNLTRGPDTLPLEEYDKNADVLWEYIEYDLDEWYIAAPVPPATCGTLATTHDFYSPWPTVSQPWAVSYSYRTTPDMEIGQWNGQLTPNARCDTYVLPGASVLDMGLPYSGAQPRLSEEWNESGTRWAGDWSLGNVSGGNGTIETPLTIIWQKTIDATSLTLPALTDVTFTDADRISADPFNPDIFSLSNIAVVLSVVTNGAGEDITSQWEQIMTHIKLTLSTITLTIGGISP